MVEDFLYQCRSCCALFCRWRRNLKQPLAAEVRGKRERILVLHHKFQNMSQSFGFVSVVEAHASAVKGVLRGPTHTREKPMTSCDGRPDLQVLQHACWSKSVFDVNQVSSGAMREI